MAARIGRGSCFKVGTAGALDLILGPWHYEKMPAYPSLPLLLEKGFRVLPASWRKLDASRALIEYSQKHASPRMLEHLFTAAPATNHNEVGHGMVARRGFWWSRLLSPP